MTMVYHSMPLAPAAPTDGAYVLEIYLPLRLLLVCEKGPTTSPRSWLHLI